MTLNIEPGAASGASRRNWPLAVLTATLFAERMLLGTLFLLSGTSWWTRDTSPGDYLLDAVTLALENGLTPLRPYDLFFNSVVLPHPGLFATMAGVGELLTGLALLLAFPKRVGAMGGIFLMANYGFAFGNGLVPPTGNFLLMVLLVPLLSALPYRIFTPVHWLRSKKRA